MQLSLLLTVITNTSAVFTIPPMLSWLVDFGGGTSTAPVALSGISGSTDAYSANATDAVGNAGNNATIPSSATLTGSTVELDVVAMITKLVMIVLAPLLVGKCVRSLPGVADWVGAHKWALKVVSVYALVALPWMKVSIMCSIYSICTRARTRTHVHAYLHARVFPFGVPAAPQSLPKKKTKVPCTPVYPPTSIAF